MEQQSESLKGCLMAEGGATDDWGQAIAHQADPVTTAVAAAIISRAISLLGDSLCTKTLFHTKDSHWCPFDQARPGNFPGTVWHHGKEPKESEVSSRSGREWSRWKMPSQDTVLISVCVVVQMCDVSCWPRAQIGPLLKITAKILKKINPQQINQSLHFFFLRVFSFFVC